MRTVLVVVAAAAVVGVAGGAAAHLLTRSPARAPALPSLHGQAVWRAGERAAPEFALRDQTGALVSIRGERGRPLIVTFLDSRCKQLCPREGRLLGHVERSLPPSQRAVQLIVSVDPPGDTPASARAAAREWGLAGEWHWLLGTPAQLRRVWHDYGIAVRETTHDIEHGAALYLIDKRGYERAGYLFPFQPAFVAGDLRQLAQERAS